jgi:hypothetical protein
LTALQIHLREQLSGCLGTANVEFVNGRQIGRAQS